MNPTEIYAAQLEWARKNLTNNLDFIPDDKLNWKPAPDAKSVMEIVAHMTGTVAMFTAALDDQKPAPLAVATNREEAKALISQVINAHVARIRALTPEELEEKVVLPIGEFPKSFVAGTPVIECLNHHGQFTYIQEMLGDTESHMVF